MTPSKSSQANQKVDTVVQEYMDNLLADLFPSSDLEEAPVTLAVEDKVEAKAATKTEPDATIKLSEDLAQKPRSIPEPAQRVHHTPVKESIQEEVKVEAVPQPLKVDDAPTIQEPPDTEIDAPVNVDSEEALPNTQAQVVEPVENEAAPVEIKAPVEKLFPNAPDWAQQAFDVLLFDVCGLKLAVPMEALGRIIKSEKDLNQLIGRPSWFMGAYTEAEESLYVVDTAKYIMPEKGFDLSRDGYDYLIQLQRSKWTLACQNVHTTVRIEPDQVKWRSQKGKRQWLAGTVIEQMCALVHVDTLVDILEAEAS
jgi:purine-binding chemotaxis protein CheW